MYSSISFDLRTATHIEHIFYQDWAVHFTLQSAISVTEKWNGSFYDL
mgnify:CR=1 FL=1